MYSVFLKHHRGVQLVKLQKHRPQKFTLSNAIAHSVSPMLV